MWNTGICCHSYNIFFSLRNDPVSSETMHSLICLVLNRQTPVLGLTEGLTPHSSERTSYTNVILSARTRHFTALARVPTEGVAFIDSSSFSQQQNRWRRWWLPSANFNTGLWIHCWQCCAKLCENVDPMPCLSISLVTLQLINTFCELAAMPKLHYLADRFQFIVNSLTR